MGITIVIVAGIIAFSHYRTNTPLKSPQKVDLLTQSATSTTDFNKLRGLDIDKDGDGLQDWQEGLWGTDVNNVDTDGDGTHDGEEADTHRNPLIAGPNDKIFSTSTLATSSPFTEAAKNYQAGSLTDLLSQNLITNYLNFKQQGQFDEVTQQELINALVNDSQRESLISDAFSFSDLTILPNATNEQIRLFGNTLAQVQKENLNKLSRIILRDPDTYIKTVAESYKTFAVSILKIPVPQEVSLYQLKIANNLYVTSEALVIAQDYKKDPARAVFALRQFERVETEQVSYYQKIAQFFVSSGIIFNETEDGFLWKVYETPTF